MHYFNKLNDHLSAHFEWSNYEVFNTYTGRVVAAFKGPAIVAHMYAVWLGSPFDYEDMDVPYAILPMDND